MVLGKIGSLDFSQFVLKQLYPLVASKRNRFVFENLSYWSLKIFISRSFKNFVICPRTILICCLYDANFAHCLENLAHCHFKNMFRWSLNIWFFVLGKFDVFVLEKHSNFAPIVLEKRFLKYPLLVFENFICWSLKNLAYFSFKICHICAWQIWCVALAKHGKLAQFVLEKKFFFFFKIHDW